MLVYIQATVLHPLLGLDTDRADFGTSGIQHCMDFFCLCAEQIPDAAECGDVPSLSAFALAAGGRHCG